MLQDLEENNRSCVNEEIILAITPPRTDTTSNPITGAIPPTVPPSQCNELVYIAQGYERAFLVGNVLSYLTVI